jgi:hypothetical protein
MRLLLLFLLLLSLTSVYLLIVPTQACLLNYHSVIFTTKLIIFTYYVHALVLFIQYSYYFFGEF